MADQDLAEAAVAASIFCTASRDSFATVLVELSWSDSSKTLLRSCTTWLSHKWKSSLTCTFMLIRHNSILLAVTESERHVAVNHPAIWTRDVRFIFFHGNNEHTLGPEGQDMSLQARQTYQFSRSEQATKSARTHLADFREQAQGQNCVLPDAFRSSVILRQGHSKSGIEAMTGARKSFTSNGPSVTCRPLLKLLVGFLCPFRIASEELL